MSPSRVRIRTASRLHFGLLGWGPQATRQFGGVGLMIQDPGLVIEGEAAGEWSFEGPLESRARELVGMIVEGCHGENSDLNLPAGARIRIDSAPSQHVGLGVGTQLGLAVARLVLELGGNSAPSPETLARLARRGRRSGIGLHGFFHGGLIVDGGRSDDTRLPPMVARLPFPDEWSILIVQPPGPRGRHGDSEIAAFETLPPLPDRLTERLCRLVLLGILPAIAEKDLKSFGAALSELQYHIGAAFAPTQGGIYASPQSEQIIAEMREFGLDGAGQSSWGPTLYAFGSRSVTDSANIRSRLFDRFALDHDRVRWSRASNHGAIVVRTCDEDRGPARPT
jgi:beta-ribofuranosylaminobenzene 5'-phosphate synthase